MYSPKATINRASVLLALLPIFTQNLMFIRCSGFLNSFFRQPYIAHSERDDTMMRKEGGTKGKQGNGVGNPVIGKGEAGHSLPYTTTLPSSG
jgi:hypothetical protein